MQTEHRCLGVLVASVAFLAVSIGHIDPCCAVSFPGLVIDGAFPGGNIVVDKIEGDHVYVHQDLRDTVGPWFYWHFRVCGAAGRTLTFHFTQGKVLGPQGPCYSLDRGATWQWLGGKRSNTADEPPKDGFVFRFSVGAEEVRFCLSIPYVQSDLVRFLQRHKGNPALKADVLCKTAQNRTAELLYLGRLDGGAQYRLAFTCRHHACESVASYVLEGFMNAVLADTPAGLWFRRQTAIFAVPFVDKDGVEAGDQGKNRKPHDHNRDYSGEAIYPTVAAIKRLLPAWANGKLDVAIDLHCPSLGDGLIQFIGGPQEEIWQRTLELSRKVEAYQRSPLRHDSLRNVPFGTSWNKGAGLRDSSFAGWARTLPNLAVGTTIEMPYSEVHGTPVTVDAVRMWGADLANALHTYMQESLPR